DYRVDFFDLCDMLGTNYNTKQPATWAEGDVNGDGVVNFFDLTELFTGHYNTGRYWSPDAVAATAAPTAAAEAITIQAAAGTPVSATAFARRNGLAARGQVEESTVT